MNGFASAPATCEGKENPIRPFASHTPHWAMAVLARPSAVCTRMLTAICIMTYITTVGCVGNWRPSAEGISAPPKNRKVTFVDRIAANRMGRWVYESRSLPVQEQEQPRDYVREITADRVIEGAFYGRRFLPLQQYLQQQPTATTQPSPQPVPRAPLQGGTAVYFDLETPSEPVPPELETQGQLTFSTPITYYDYRGIRQASGTLTHDVMLEGVEDVQCPAGQFADCMRVRSRIQIEFGWIASIDLTTYLWLSGEMGEVRRVQRLSGWFLIFWFGSAQEYLLKSFQPLAEPRPKTPLFPEKWDCGAVLLTGNYPGIRLAGMVTDLQQPPKASK